MTGSLRPGVVFAFAQISDKSVPFTEKRPRKQFLSGTFRPENRTSFPCVPLLSVSSPGTTWKAVFHLLFNRIVRKRFVNGKQTICSICSRVVDSKYKIQSLGDEKTLLELERFIRLRLGWFTYGLWFYLLFGSNFTFLLQINYLTLPYPKTSKGKFEPRMSYICIYMYMLWSSFIPWLKFYFLLFQTGSHILLYPKTYKTA